MTAVGGTGFFDQIGISNIVWLDDLFDAKASPSRIDLVQQIAIALETGASIDHPKLGDLTRDDSPQEWARLIEERLSEAERQTLLDQISQPEEVESEQHADYSLSEIETVISSLGGTIRRVGLAEWAEVKEELIAETPSGVFLVDRERILDGERTNVGDEIVQELVERCGDDVFVVVLTHSVGPNETERLRNRLATDLGIEISRLGVVSKRQEDVSLETGVRGAVRVTLMQLTCMIVTGRIVKVMQSSLAATESALRSLPIEALDLAVFENSLQEGASEVDVLSRILRSRQRTDVDTYIAGTLEIVHLSLTRLRKLRFLEALPPQPPSDASLLRQWRRDEVFDAETPLNALLSPVACGDVFLKEGTDKYYVLLGQPCDLTVRPDGSRSAREAVFVKLMSSYSATSGGHRYFEVPALQGTARWALDFREWASVNMECVEWTSFNKDGKVALARSGQSPIGLLPGWQKRFERARNSLKPKQEYRLSLGNITPTAVIASTESVAFPYRRVARLRSPWATSAYAAFATFHARAAFDHDFAKGVGTPTTSVVQSAQVPTSERG